MKSDSYKPLISICVPSYNSAQFLPTLFDSLLAQSYSRVELIFIDDASLDGSFAIAQRYRHQLEQKFERVEFIEQKQNTGALLSLTRAFSRTSGELVGYLDADDYYAPEKLQANVDFFAENPEFGAVHSGFHAIMNGYESEVNYLRRHVEFMQTVPQGWVYQDLLRINFICAGTLLVKREFFERCYDFPLFRRRDYGMGDYPGHLALSKVTQIGYIDRPLFYYRIRKESMSHTQDESRFRKMLHDVARVQQDSRFGLLNPLPPGASCLVRNL